MLAAFDQLCVHTSAGVAMQWPPSTTSTCPVMYAAAFERKNTAAAAISSIAPNRPAGMLDLTRSPLGASVPRT